MEGKPGSAGFRVYLAVLELTKEAVKVNGEKSIEGPEEGFHEECASWREFMLQCTSLLLST